MDKMTLTAQPRAVGKKETRELRRNEMVPCVLYGSQNEPVHFAIDELTVNRMVYSSELQRMTIEVEGEGYDVVLKDVTFHPVTDRPLHADFQVLTAGEKITVTVPVQFIGTPVGQEDGGDTQYILNEVTIRVLPKDIPDHLEVNIEHLTIGDAIHISDLEYEDIDFQEAPTRTVVTVVAPQIYADLDEEEEGLETGAALLDEPEEGEEEGEVEGPEA